MDYNGGTSPSVTAIVEGILSRQVDGLKPQLTPHGYDTKSLAAPFDAKPAESADCGGGLEPARARELTEDMRGAGLPLRPPCPRSRAPR